MVHQTAINGKHSESNPVPVADRVANLASDLTSLVELQFKLFRLDWEASCPRFCIALLGMAISSALLVGSLPVLIAGSGWLIAQALGASTPMVITVLSLLLIVASFAGLIVANVALMSAAKIFERSQFELNANLKWIRTVIEQSSKSRM